MADSGNNFLEKLLEKSMGLNFYSLKGLLKSLAIIDLLLFLGIKPFSEFSNLGKFLIFIIIFDIIISIIWSILRKIPRFKKDKIGILFALPYGAENSLTNDVLNKLYNKLQYNIHQRSLTSEFETKRAKPNNCPEKTEEGFEILEDSNATVMISGFVEEGNISKDEKVVQIPTITFFYKDYLRSLGAKVSFVQSIQDSLPKDKLIVRENRDLIDIEYVSNNLDLTALYIIGSGFYIKVARERKPDSIDKAIGIFEYLFVQLQSDSRESWREVIRRVLYLSYNLKYSLMGWLPRDRADKDKILEGERIIARQKNIIKEHPGAYIQNGMLLFLKGDFPGAKQELELAIKYTGGIDGAAHYSYAFIEFYQKRFKPGKEHLERAIDLSADKLQLFNLDQIINFYHDALETDSVPQLNYPLGIIYKKVKNDPNFAKKHLEAFIEWAKNNDNWAAPEKEKGKFINIAENNLKDLKPVEV